MTAVDVLDIKRQRSQKPHRKYWLRKLVQPSFNSVLRG
jgi:hypothetical protein